MVRGDWPGRLDGGLLCLPSLVFSLGRRISQGGLCKERPQIPPESLLSYQKRAPPGFSVIIKKPSFFLCFHSRSNHIHLCSVTHALLIENLVLKLISHLHLYHRNALVDTIWSSGKPAQILCLLPSSRAASTFHTNNITLSCHHVRHHGASSGSAFIHSRED